MGIVSEHINEKFTSESDPIEDMRIGTSGLLSIFIEELKQEKYDMNWKEEFNNDDDLLWVCARYNKIEFVKYLLNKGANIHCKSDRALRWAAYKNNYEIVQFLLEMGADVNAYDSGAYELAKDNGHTEILKLLKSYGGTPPKGNRPLEEKFIENSNPIHDMGIGVYTKKSFNTIDELYDWLSEVLPVILKTDSIPDDILNDPHKSGYFINRKYVNIITDYAFRYLELNEKVPEVYFESRFRDFLKEKYPYLPVKDWKKEYYEDLWKEKNSLNDYKDKIDEKFEEDSDPIHDLGIGIEYIYNNIKPGDVFILKKDIPTLGKIFIRGAYIKIRDVKIRHNNYYDKLIYYSLYLNKHDFENKIKRDESDWGWNYDFFKDYISPTNIKKFVNERFEEDSDPIHDMGIGIRAIWDNLKEGDILRFKETLTITSNGVPTGKVYKKGTYLIILRANEEYDKKDVKNIVFNYYATTDLNNLNDNIEEFSNHWLWGYNFFVKYFELVSRNYVKESLNEKFKEESDPIHDMGIGGNYVNFEKKSKTMTINQWLKYIRTLNNKTIEGNFISLPYLKKVNVNFKIDKIMSYMFSIDNKKIVFYDINDNAFETIKNETYFLWK